MVKKILLCGCGNIGFRHLQALAQLKTPAHITMVEPFAQGHARITDFITSEEANGAERYRLLGALPQTREAFDLAVITTRADVRQAVYEDIVTHHDVTSILFEKILFQTVTALDTVERDLEQRKIAGFVNCGRRGFDNYRAMAAEFAGDTPTDITVTGSAFGLASNAVHFLDLAEFLNGSPLKEVDLSQLNSDTAQSKRDGLVEIFGTLRANTANGGKLSVTCADEPGMAIAITVRHAGRNIQIDELGNTKTEGGQTVPFGTKFVSGMPYLYDDALQTGDPGLTPYNASARQHRLYLGAMCDHLDLPSGNDTLIPIS